MKAPALLLCLALVACKKDPQSVSYTASCHNCYVWYQASDKTEATASVKGYWQTFVADTLIVGTDTTLVMDSTLILGQWSATVELEADAKPYIRARNEAGSTTTTVGMNGSTASASAFMEVIEVH